MSSDWCCTNHRGIRLAIQVLPNARTTEVVGVFDDVLKIRLHAQPIEGKANEALIRYLAATLRVPKSTIVITHGHASKRKMVELSESSLTVDDVRRLLLSTTA